MSEATSIKRKKRNVSKALSKIRSAMTGLDTKNGPGDWGNVDHFLGVGEYELALEAIEWAIIKQDLAVAKKVDDEINDAKRMLGLFSNPDRTPYQEPDPNKINTPRSSNTGEHK